MSEIIGTLVKYLVGLLAIVAVLIVGYRSMAADKTSTAVAQVGELSSNIQQMYNKTSAYTGITAAIAINDGAVPVEMLNVAKTGMISPWNQAVTVTVDATDGSLFDIVYAGVPADACGKLTQGVKSNGVYLNGVSLGVNPTPAAIAAACNNAVASVGWSFGH